MFPSGLWWFSKSANTKRNWTVTGPRLHRLLQLLVDFPPDATLAVKTYSGYSGDTFRNGNDEKLKNITIHNSSQPPSSQHSHRG